MAEVEYRNIQGFPGYRVGSDGSVWSSLRGGEWRRLKPRNNGSRSPCRKGYYQAVRLSRGCESFSKLVHVLVLESFVGPCPEGMETRHLDYDPRNNRLVNLRWGTRGENIEDMQQAGTMLRGSEKPNAKLTEEDVVAIHRLYERGITVRYLALAFCVCDSSIRQVIKATRWRHVPYGPRPTSDAVEPLVLPFIA
jgi:hypothetical protein